jgi:putative restriction endonuclease
MRYWWVNQGKTYRSEVPGGYMWSPKTNNKGGRSPYYQNMTLVDQGDVVLSYAGSEIRAVGIAVSTAYESPKPQEFGAAGAVWAGLGWRVEVEFNELPKSARVRPKEYLQELLPLRPEKYSPIQENGNSLTAYLFEVSEEFAHVILSKVDSTVEIEFARLLERNDLDLRKIGEDKLEQFLKLAPIDETERTALISARRGQGRFREGVSYVEPACRFTGVTTPQLLIASHIQPWHRCSTNAERLDPFNGLMLTPTYDRLFDSGFISFSPHSELLISKNLAHEDMQKIRMDPDFVTDPFRPSQLKYLEYHREHVFKAA